MKWNQITLGIAAGAVVLSSLALPQRSEAVTTHTVSALAALVPAQNPADARKVRVELSTFRCFNADEDGALSDGDEPYLMPLMVWADGTTIKVSQLNTASVRTTRATKVHDNLGRSNVKAGDQFGIPKSTGTYENTILPIDAGNLADGRKLAQVGVLVVACEEDGTTDSAMAAGYAKMCSIIEAELNKAIRTLSQPNIGQVTQKVQDAVIKVVTKKTLSGFNIFGIVDPDGFVGSGFAQFTYDQLDKAGANGLPINMIFEDKDAGVKYGITGSARVITQPVNKTVRVTIPKIKAIDDLEGFGMGDPDFVARITIDGQAWTSPEKSGETITPNWSFAKRCTVPEITITIELFEKDGVSADERCDINPKKSVKSLSMRYNILTNKIKGDIVGNGNANILARGAGDSDRCEITFNVSQS